MVIRITLYHHHVVGLLSPHAIKCYDIIIIRPHTVLASVSIGLWKQAYRHVVA